MIKRRITKFEGDVTIKDKDNNVIKLATEYDRKNKFFLLKDNITFIDKYGNEFRSNEATYDEKLKILKVTERLILLL